MTLHEIEETLHTLQSRHSDLNEQMLVTLLRSGGWEEKNIQEAIFLFRSEGGKTEEIQAETLPSLQRGPVFMPQTDENHLLSDHNQEKAEEPQSLIEPSPLPAQAKKEELPHNLPLRPFETSEHVWPFSRYKDVFYGDIETKPLKEEAGKEPAVTAEAETKTEEVQVVKKEERPTAVPEVEIVPVPLTKGDEGLVILACIMLLAILLLLGYMYSNGRL